MIASKRAKELFIRPKDHWTTIDEMIYGYTDYYQIPGDQAVSMRFKAIKESLEHHYTKSKFYNQLCREYDFNPDQIKTEDDFQKIPLLPDTFFKEYPHENPKDVFDWLKKISNPYK